MLTRESRLNQEVLTWLAGLLFLEPDDVSRLTGEPVRDIASGGFSSSRTQPALRRTINQHLRFLAMLGACSIREDAWYVARGRHRRSHHLETVRTWSDEVRLGGKRDG